MLLSEAVLPTDRFNCLSPGYGLKKVTTNTDLDTHVSRWSNRV